MRKLKSKYPYFFDFKTEYRLYKRVGKWRAKFSKYTEWHDYVYTKYSTYKTIPNNLINFKHFLLQKVNDSQRFKDSNSTGVLALANTLTALVIAYMFALLSAVEESLSGPWAYVSGAIYVAIVFSALYMWLGYHNITYAKHLCFYQDYIDIIDEILNSTTKGVLTMPLPQKYSTSAIYSLQENVQSKLPPSRIHQRIVAELCTIINNYIASNNGTCEVDIAPFSVFLNAEDERHVEPDVSVICDRNKLTDRGCVGAPDWIIEVVSPGSRRMDYHTKLFKYHTAGVREYWIVDPLESRVTVYDLEHEDMSEYTFADTVKAGIYTDLSIDFNNLNI